MSGEAILSARLNPITWIVGTWQSTNGNGEFPTIKPFQYIETIEFSQVGAQPLLKYTGSSRHPQSGNPMHQETGFLRIRGENELSFMVSHNFGLATVEEGVAEPHKIVLKTSSSNIARMSADSAKANPGTHVTELERKFILDSATDELTQELFMATEKTPQLTFHLRAVYKRKD